MDDGLELGCRRTSKRLCEMGVDVGSKGRFDSFHFFRSLPVDLREVLVAREDQEYNEDYSNLSFFVRLAFHTDARRDGCTKVITVTEPSTWIN